MAKQRRAIHPGAVLRDHFEKLGSSIEDAAAALHVSPIAVSIVVWERWPVTAELALRLERWLGVEAEFWLDLQRQVDLREAKAVLDREPKIRRRSGRAKRGGERSDGGLLHERR